MSSPVDRLQDLAQAIMSNSGVFEPSHHRADSHGEALSKCFAGLADLTRSSLPKAPSEPRANTSKQSPPVRLESKPPSGLNEFIQTNTQKIDTTQKTSSLACKRPPGFTHPILRQNSENKG